MAAEPKTPAFGVRNTILALAGIAWSAILVIGTGLYDSGERSAEVAQLHKDLDYMDNKLRAEMTTQDARAERTDAVAKELAISINGTSTVIAEQLRIVTEKIFYNTGRLDSIKDQLEDIKQRIAALEIRRAVVPPPKGD